MANPCTTCLVQLPTGDVINGRHGMWSEIPNHMRRASDVAPEPSLLEEPRPDAQARAVADAAPY